MVDSLILRSSLDSTGRGSFLERQAVELVMDSTTLRVTLRPVLANECDRVETVATSLARGVTIRIPDGVTRGDHWRDSAVTFVCRDGVPLTVTTVVESRLQEQSARRATIERTGVIRITGSGGPSFRLMEIRGEGSLTDRVEVDLTLGVVERLRGTQSLTLRMAPRTAPGRRPMAMPNVPKAPVVVTQRMTTTVDRLRD